jgi:multidrug efflux pump subunit AcrA (membrane-fusion protein)
MALPRKYLIIGAVVVALVAAGLCVAFLGGSSSSSPSEVVVFSRVQTRTLQDTVSLDGTLVRKQLRNVTSANSGVVSAVDADNTSTVQAGEAMFAINGRDAIAEDGTVPFFRPLVAGDQGEDVLELKEILAAAGDDPGPMNNYFNQQTEFALAQWQAQHHYPNATPANPESVAVALQQGEGYKVGDQDSAGLIIGPPPPQTAARTTVGGPDLLAADVTPARPAPTTPPAVTVESLETKVTPGLPAVFIVTASKAPTTNLTVNLTTGGTAGTQDIVAPATSVTIAAGTTTALALIETRITTAVQNNPTIVVTVDGGTGYTVGTPSSAQTSIVDNNVPSLSISGSATVTPGQTATLTVTATPAPAKNTQVILSVNGSALAGTDFDPVDPVVTLPAGATSATVAVKTIPTTAIEPSKYLVVSLSQSTGTYSISTPAAAVITISEPTAKPTVTLTSATTYLQKGSPYQVSVGLSQAQSTALTIHLSYGGTAVAGTDYAVPAGSIVVPAGQTSLAVSIPTVTSNAVEPNRVLTVSVAPNTAYDVGTPSSVSVTINSTVVPTLTITASTTSVTQGGAASFVITASQAPVKDTTVTFGVEGTAQPGQSYVPLTGTALLAAGQTQVTVVLQSIQNNVEFEPTDMIVGHWPTRIGQVDVKAGAPVAVGETILALTEPNLSVTLEATAAERTKLRVGQHCTVKIDGETTSSPGVISQLNSTPTAPSGTSGALYQGRIEVSGLNGADGSQVAISVVDQQVTNALTVPISAVKQNGTGADVVRVIDLHDNKITEVPVTTGLTQGSYIQVKKGLHLGQVVISEVDQ